MCCSQWKILSTTLVVNDFLDLWNYYNLYDVLTHFSSWPTQSINHRCANFKHSNTIRQTLESERRSRLEKSDANALHDYKAKHDYTSYHWLPRSKKAHSVSESIHQSAEGVTSLEQSVDGDMWVAATVEGTSNTITPTLTSLPSCPS